MQRQDRMLPAAILGAGALIGAGLFFGLRQSRPAVPAAGSFLPDRPEAGATIQVPEPSAELRARVAGQVLEALEKDRARLVQTCWSPSAAKSGDPARETFRFRFAFNAQG